MANIQNHPSAPVSLPCHRLKLSHPLSHYHPICRCQPPSNGQHQSLPPPPQNSAKSGELTYTLSTMESRYVRPLAMTLPRLRSNKSLMTLTMASSWNSPTPLRHRPSRTLSLPQQKYLCGQLRLPK